MQILTFAFMSIKRGDIVEVDFYDHVEDGRRAMRFVVYGRVEEITDRLVTVQSWTHKRRRSKPDGNEKRYTIMRCACESITKLQRVE